MRYYVGSTVPVTVDYAGSSLKNAPENPSFVGIQAGYPIFITDNVSIDPSLRYNISMNSDFFDSIFDALIAFTIYLN